MTLATELNYVFFNNTIFYKGLNCLFSVSVIQEDIAYLNLKKEQVVLTSPIIGNCGHNSDCTVYRSLDVDLEDGLFLPIISWALEFTKQIQLLDMPVYMKQIHGMMDMILLQIWEHENIRQSEEGLNIDLLNPTAWESIIRGKIFWNNYDSLSQAEYLVKNGVVRTEEILLPHVHVENADQFRRSGISRDVIFDW